MNTYVTLACLLAVVGLSHGSAIGGYGLGGYGGSLVGPVYAKPYLVPAAISYANQYRAAPIPVIRTVYSAPVITKVVPVVKSISPIGLGYGGLGSIGYGGLSGLGHGSYGLHG